MGTGKSVFIAIIAVNIEPAKTIHTLELSEPIEGNFARPGDKLQEFRTLFFVERADGAPKPLNLGRGRLIIVVFGVILPVVDIYVRKARDEEFEFLLVENRDELGGNDVMEACWGLAQNKSLG